MSQWSIRGTQSGRPFIHLRRRSGAEIGQCHATAESSRSECQGGVGVRRGSKDGRVRGRAGIVVLHG